MDVREKLVELFYDNNVRCYQKIEGLADDVMDIIADVVPVRHGTGGMMMARLIDADEAKANIITFATECGSTILPIDAILMILNQIDTVDTIPVVRCRDCEIHGNCATENVFSFAGINNPFCCAGKRKDSDGNG